MLEHDSKEVQAADEVRLVVALRVSHGVWHARQGGEVKYGVEGEALEARPQGVGVEEVALDELVRQDELAVSGGEVVEDHDVVTRASGVP